MFVWLQLKFLIQGKNMYDNEQELEEKMTKIVDQMGYLLMDVILISFKRINKENQLLKELFDIRMEELREDDF